MRLAKCQRVAINLLPIWVWSRVTSRGESIAGLASQRTWLQPWIVLLVAVLAMLVPS